jgi:hypothetical protein
MPWLALCFALAIHVAEEIRGGFLSVYNQAVEATRQLFPFAPLPHVSLTVWLSATIGFVALLLLLTPLAYRGLRGMRTLMLWVIALAIANVVAHSVGSILSGRMLPGTYSTLALAAASVYAIVADRRRARAMRAARH